MRTTSSLDGQWTAFVDREGNSDGLVDLLSLERSKLARAQATVPGTVEEVLQALGDLPADLYQGCGVLAARKTEGYRYFYGRRFELDQDQLRARSIRLVFDGVDTLATYLAPQQACTISPICNRSAASSGRSTTLRRAPLARQRPPTRSRAAAHSAQAARSWP